MRDLREELKHWDGSVPVEWEPGEGGILVGFLRESASVLGTTAERNVVVIEEERTGTPVLVSLDMPQMTALFEMHSPRTNDRVGIRCFGTDANGALRFGMLVDRDHANAPQSGECGRAGSEECDDCVAATPEERDYIEQMWSGEGSDQDAGNRIEGMIARQMDELARRPRALGHLEALISQSARQGADPALDEVLTESVSEAPRRSRALMPGVVVLVLSGLAAGYAYVAPTYHWWMP